MDITRGVAEGLEATGARRTMAAVDIMARTITTAATMTTVTTTATVGTEAAAAEVGTIPATRPGMNQTRGTPGTTAATIATSGPIRPSTR